MLGHGGVVTGSLTARGACEFLVLRKDVFRKMYSNLEFFRSHIDGMGDSWYSRHACDPESVNK